MAETYEKTMEFLKDYKEELRSDGGLLIVGHAIALIEQLKAKNVEVEKDWDEIDGFMNRIDNQITETLEKIGERRGNEGGMPWRVDDACRLLESIPQLKAEIERLTPKPMSLERAVEVMNNAEFLRQANWEINTSDGWRTVQCRRFFSSLHEESAVRIARDIEREKEAGLA